MHEVNLTSAIKKLQRALAALKKAQKAHPTLAT
jgi:hypothetical protein